MEKNRPGVLKKKLNIEFLESTIEDHKRAAQELALTELHSLELAFPGFNTIAALSKSELNRLMKSIKKKFANTKVYLVLVGIVTDTLTCMIKNAVFYEEYASDNKNSINLMLDLLKGAPNLIRYTEDFEAMHQLPLFISILERSFARISNCDQYNDFQEIISELKLITQLRQNKENSFKKIKLDAPQKPQGQVLRNSNNNNIEKPVVEHPVVALKDDKLATQIGHPVVEATIHAVPVQQTTIYKPKNAFEFMMMSSRIQNKKKKNTV